MVNLEERELAAKVVCGKDKLDDSLTFMKDVLLLHCTCSSYGNDGILEQLCERL